MADSVDGRNIGEGLRYVKIRSAVNPYDPEWELYLEARWGWQLAQTRKVAAGSSSYGRSKRDDVVAAVNPCESQRKTVRSTIGLAQPRRSGHGGQLELLHANCHRQIHVREQRTKAAASRQGRS